MASIIMHMSVSELLYKKLKTKININYYDYMLGSIAPDISKQIGESKQKSHFITGSQDIPDINKFLTKYINTLNNSFNLGYFIHLYTDRLFYRDYLPLFIQSNLYTSVVKRLDGKVLKVFSKDAKNMLYNDYTNLNISLINEYNLTLDIFYNEFIKPKTNITEIPTQKLDLLINNAGIIIQNLSKEKEYIIDITSIKSFIEDAVEEIYTKLISLKII